MKYSVFDITSILSAVGVSAVITQPGSAGPPIVPDVLTPIKVKFKSNGIDHMGMLTDKPQAICKESDFTGVDHKTCQLEISGVAYRITKPKSTDDGFVTIDLSRA
jgi:hypothetical protein